VLPSSLLSSLLCWPGIGSFPYVQGLAFTRSGLLDETEANDLEVHFVPFLGHDAEQLQTNFLLNKEGCAAFDIEKNFDDYGVTFLPTLLLPQSSGTVKLKSKDPTEYPAIDPQYLKMEHDVEVLVRGFKFCRKMATETKAFADLLGEEIVDDSIPHDPKSDEYIRELVRRAVITVYHPIGTAKMGPVDDPNTVCDPTLKVKGLKNIRIADASIMPSIPSANTNAPCIMVGEKASDLIKADAKAKAEIDSKAEIHA
jgi:choline dehydrogenase